MMTFAGCQLTKYYALCIQTETLREGALKTLKRSHDNGNLKYCGPIVIDFSSDSARLLPINVRAYR